MEAVLDAVINKNVRVKVEIWARFQHLYMQAQRTQRQVIEEALDQWCDREERRLVEDAEPMP